MLSLIPSLLDITVKTSGQGVMTHTCYPSTLGVRGGVHVTSGVHNQPGQSGETLSLLKIQKLSRRGRGCLQSQVLGRLRQENELLEPGRQRLQ